MLLKPAFCAAQAISQARRRIKEQRTKYHITNTQVLLEEETQSRYAQELILYDIKQRPHNITRRVVGRGVRVVMSDREDEVVYEMSYD